MSSTTQKHRDFINEPMGNKSVKAIPGIGEEFAAELKACNMDKAYQLYGQFLILDRNEERFNDWLTSQFRLMNVKHQKACYQALKEYDDRYSI